MDLASLQFRLATVADVPELRVLVNSAYQQLADLGLNFTGTYQNEEITKERMVNNDVYLAFLNDELVGTISLEVETHKGILPVLYLTQLAVAPKCKRQGLGRRLLALAEEKAREKGILRLQLDTAVPANHLVRLYLSQGFEIIDEVQWEGKTYRSYIMEKRLKRADSN